MKKQQRAKGNHKIPFPAIYRIMDIAQAVIRFVSRIYRAYEQSYIVRTIKSNLRYAENQEARRRAKLIAESTMEDM